jgi:hypothetical protein
MWNDTIFQTNSHVTKSTMFLLQYKNGWVFETEGQLKITSLPILEKENLDKSFLIDFC